jgi:hypothetical protein
MPEQAGVEAGDPYAGRPPTSHERRAGQPWDASYASEEELRAVFERGRGWRVGSIRPERCETRFHPQGAPAWLATIERI